MVLQAKIRETSYWRKPEDPGRLCFFMKKKSNILFYVAAISAIAIPTILFFVLAFYVGGFFDGNASAKNENAHPPLNQAISENPPPVETGDIQPEGGNNGDILAPS